MAAAKKSDNTALFAIGGVAVAILVLPKLLSAKKPATFGGGVAGSGGGYYPPGTDNTSLLQKILAALQGKNQPQAGKLPTPGNFNSNPSGKMLNALNASGPMSISQALFGGVATDGVQQGVLAGIFNMQQGAGDFAGDSSASIGQGWLDTNQWGLGDLFAQQEPQIGGYQDTQLFDFGTWGSPVYDLPTDYTETSYGGYIDNPYLDSGMGGGGGVDLSFGDGGGGTDWSNYDWSGGNGGWDIPS